MTETNESQENQNEEEAAVPTMTTVERAEMLLQQDAAIRAKINGGAALDEAVDPSNKEFGPLAHPEQVQMRVAKRAMMLKEGIQPYPVTLDVTATIEEVRAKYDGKLEAGDETEDVVGIAGRVLFLRNAGGLCFVQLSAGDGTKIQGMIKYLFILPFCHPPVQIRDITHLRKGGILIHQTDGQVLSICFI